MATTNLTEIQKERLKRLEYKLQLATYNRDLKTAKELTLDIQGILRPLRKEARLMQAKNWLYETAIEAKEYEYAIDGLKAVKLKTNKQTRVHLEATALLAIAYLRKNDFENAKPFIKDVLQNDKVIKSEKKRTEFRKEIINRFNEEVALFAMNGCGTDELNTDEIHEMAITQSSTYSESEILSLIGGSIPHTAIRSIFNVDDFSKKQLPSAERLKLPAPQHQIKEDELGKTLFSSVKRTLYKSLCNPDSDIYKAWFSEGVKTVLSKNYITAAVISTFTGLGIGIKAIVVSVIALVIKFGIEVYCTHNKPNGIMDLR